MIYRSRPAPGSTIARTYSMSYYETFILAFMHIFWTEQFDSPAALKKKVAQFMAEMKRNVAKEIQERGVTCEEVGSPIGFPVFKRLCQLMAASGSAEHVYTRCWLNLKLGLIARSDNFINSHINHLGWRDDSMIIFFHKSKTNQ